MSDRERWWRQHGGIPKDQRLVHDHYFDTLVMRMEGLTYREIGEKFNVCPQRGHSLVARAIWIKERQPPAWRRYLEERGWQVWTPERQWREEPRYRG